MPTQTVHGVDYYYEVAGSGPPLVLLHGFTGSVETWAAHTPALAHRYRTIAADLLGHGRTDAPPDPARYGMAAAAADLATLLQDLTTEPITLLGYSMGGRLALYFALTYPERVHTLILESASPGLAEVDARQARIVQDTALAGRIESEGIAAFVDYWEAIPLFASQRTLPAEVRNRLRQQRLRNRALGLANSLRGMGSGVQPSLWERLGDLSMPVQLIAGELDTKFVEINRGMAAQIPNASLTIIPNAGHTVHLEQPELFQTLVLGAAA